MELQMNGWRISYDTTGNGIPILFIHGFPLNRILWEPQATYLAPYARVIMPDLRGFGESEVPAGHYSIDMYAEDCINLLDMLGISRPVVVCGLSMGGYIALALYRRYAERVAGIILTATRAGADTEEGKLNRNKAITTARSSGVTAVVEDMLPKMFAPSTYEEQPNLIEHVHKMMTETPIEGMVGAIQAMRDRRDANDVLTTIRKPALIIHGRDDQLIPFTEAQNMHRSIQDAELIPLQQAGHLLNLERPIEFNEAVRKFINRC